MRRTTIIGLATTAATLSLAPTAFAQPAVGVVGGGSNDALVTFDTDSPAAVTSSRAVTGLLGDERIEGVDFRWIPSAANAAMGGTVGAAGLYALGVSADGASGHVYRIDPATAIATPVNAASVLAFNPAATTYGFDFNPSADAIRVTNDADQSFRVSPVSGAFAATDTSLTPAGQKVSTAAYDRVDIAPTAPATASNTTLFVINPTTDQLAYQGGLNSNPSPNAGALNAIGALGVDVDPAAPATFDIGYDGEAFATLSPVGGTAGFYRINTTTGAATLVGSISQPLIGAALIPGTVQFLQTDFSQSERANATITVTRTGSTGRPATVNYTTGGGTAIAGTDYTPVSGTLAFAAGEARRSFTIPITNDTIEEGDETVGIAIGGSGPGVALGTPSQATLTIIDNDGPIVPPTPAPPVVPTPAPDKTPPVISLSLVRSSYSLSAFKKGISVRVKTNEMAELEAAVNSRVTRATAARFRAGKYNLELASATRAFDTSQVIKLRPKSALIGSPRKSFKVRLKVVASDSAGNESTRTKIITIKK